jgi:hypothetical protein
MKGGELMRSERTAAEFDILVAFLGCARTCFSILRYGHFKGTRSNSNRLLCRSSSSIPAEAGLGLVKAASDAGALGDAGEAMKACDAIVVRSGWGWCVFPAIGTGLVKQQDQRFLLLAG